MYENIKRGEYQIGDKVYYFRSGWEAIYASYLNFLVEQKAIKSWRYEPKFFDFMPFGKIRGVTRYLPDFEVTENNGTVHYDEVKGVMDSKSKTKLKLMADHFPEVKVNLIEKDFIQSLAKQKRLLKLY